MLTIPTFYADIYNIIVVYDDVADKIHDLYYNEFINLRMKGLRK